MRIAKKNRRLSPDLEISITRPKILNSNKKLQTLLLLINPEIAEAHKNKELSFKSTDFPSAIKEFDEGLRRDPLKQFFTVTAALHNQIFGVRLNFARCKQSNRIGLSF